MTQLVATFWREQSLHALWWGACVVCKRGCQARHGCQQIAVLTGCHGLLKSHLEDGNVIHQLHIPKTIGLIPHPPKKLLLHQRINSAAQIDYFTQPRMGILDHSYPLAVRHVNLHNHAPSK
eukprot:157916-Pelagomonas_calceolata.AAC.1